jgi:1-phosphofructokinase
VTVTAELATDDSVELHFHAGGQGYWIARMVRTLGEPVVLCLPLGGEAGDVFRALAGRESVELEVVESDAATAAYVHDRRDGERDTLVESSYPAAGRHELDELHSRVLTRAVRGGVCVLAGHPDPSDRWRDLYERLTRDLGSLGVEDADVPEIEEAVQSLVGQGAQDVVVTRAGEPTVASWAGRWYLVEPPKLDVVDARGGGDATTAAVGVARDWDGERVLRLAAAAGTASIARRGLASASADAIETLLPFVQVEPLQPVGRG